MVIKDTDTPVVLLRCGLGSLAIMRSLGRFGVKVVGVTEDPNALAIRSRYCHRSVYFDFFNSPPDELERLLFEIADEFDRKPILLATSDETAIFIAESYERLSARFLIAQNEGPIVERLANKMTMFDVAMVNDLPVPKTMLPKSVDDARQLAKHFRFPVMLKGAMGNRMFAQSGTKMESAHSVEEMVERFRELEDPETPNVMIQEMIPGPDDEVYIFNGFFDSNSDCLASFTGKKIRQFPIHRGCAAMGECSTVDEVAEQTIRFMKRIGYKGILDIGYKHDRRDGRYKVLDINPRVGQAFRIFVAENGLDVVRAMYLSLTNQEIPQPVVPREGRRWVIEDIDAVSALQNRREGLLTFWQWIKSYRSVQEGMYFSLRDPVPFLIALGEFAVKFVRWNAKKLRRRETPVGQQRRLESSSSTG